AVTDNSSVFTFENSMTFIPPNANTVQNYTPTSSTATRCPTSGNGYNWTCRFVSDQFSAGQQLSTGTSTADLYLDLSSLRRFFSARAGGSGRGKVSRPGRS